MRRESLAKNFVFQFAYQALILIVPLLMSPYLTRTLMPDSLGVSTYVHSIAYYFIIAANLGISVHGRRLLSRVSSDPILLRRSFWSLFYTHIGISTAVVLVYFASITLIRPANLTIYLISGIYVLSALFDITWLFYGLENFSSVVIKNAAVKVIECVLVFCIIKSPDDLWKYTLIISLGSFLGQVLMLPQAFKMVPPIRVSKADIIPHIKPLLLFSVSVIASALYTIFDKTLLGLLSTSANVAFYEYAYRIVAIPQTFIGIIGTVMLPRACRLVEAQKADEQKKYISYSFFLSSFIGMGAMFGIYAVAEKLAIVYYGEAFEPCGKIMMALAPLSYIVGTGSILRSQYLVPNGIDKQYNLCIIYNAIINLVLSAALIPILGVYGAVVGTLAAEIFGLVYQTVLCRKIEAWKGILKTLIPFACLGAMMFGFIKILSRWLTVSVRSLIIEIVAGAMFYVVASLVYMLIFKKEIWRMCTGALLSKLKK